MRIDPQCSWQRSLPVFLRIFWPRIRPSTLSAQTQLIMAYLLEFQLLHTPAEFHAERIAWRFVIYLNLLRSVRR